MPDPIYEAKYGRGPHLAVDAIVQHKDKIALIRRMDGSWALPGGFVDSGESLLDAAIREVAEEVGIGLLQQEHIDRWIYDDPHRDPRSHIVTVVHTFILNRQEAVQAGDDAAHAEWINITDLVGRTFYADHGQILADHFFDGHMPSNQM